jgi:hypothetical protein
MSFETLELAYENLANITQISQNTTKKTLSWKFHQTYIMKKHLKKNLFFFFFNFFSSKTFGRCFWQPHSTTPQQKSNLEPVGFLNQTTTIFGQWWAVGKPSFIMEYQPFNLCI